MNYPLVTLKKGKSSSLERFHPWVFSGAIAHKPDKLEECEVVDIQSQEGKYLATAHFQIGSIMLRIISFERKIIDREFWREKLQEAIELRRKEGLLGDPHTNVFRLIHGEGDGFPGLIVDWYDKVLVLQCHSVGFFLIRKLLAELLVELLGERIEGIYDKSEHSLPFKAPVEPADGYLFGESRIWQGKEYDLTFDIDVLG